MYGVELQIFGFGRNVLQQTRGATLTGQWCRLSK
jgi:hypothetical protein